ncbi:potassium channel family protein [Streptomyces sp. PvR006]|uniref:potassium channel family protein n=1 Tax=Streptomyces sp. PvR006 TaxID=2817860 RepID=UPI0027DD9E1B|nr:potassium channel family protein [Streptomyces sp. PvR006]
MHGSRSSLGTLAGAVGSSGLVIGLLPHRQESVRSFYESVTHTGAVYFTGTVFSTVGFGDIVPRSGAGRPEARWWCRCPGISSLLGVAVHVVLGASAWPSTRRVPPSPGRNRLTGGAAAQAPSGEPPDKGPGPPERPSLHRRTKAVSPLGAVPAT